MRVRLALGSCSLGSWFLSFDSRTVTRLTIRGFLLRSTFFLASLLLGVVVSWHLGDLGGSKMTLQFPCSPDGGHGGASRRLGWPPWGPPSPTFDSRALPWHGCDAEPLPGVGKRGSLLATWPSFCPGTLRALLHLGDGLCRDLVGLLALGTKQGIEAAWSRLGYWGIAVGAPTHRAGA